MCGRYSLIAAERIATTFPRFRAGTFSETRRTPRFNVAPTQEVPGVRNDGRDAIDVLRWGMRGRINVRRETLAAWRGPVARRCILFADGFYEWRGRTPVYYTLRSGEPFAFAGIWEADGPAPAMCAIATCEPNELVRAVHDRMPVILPSSALDLWLAPEPLPSGVAAAMLQPFDAGAMQGRDVSMRLNDARYDAPDVLTYRDPVQQGFSFSAGPDSDRG